ncbi:MAG TPA: histidine kinase [Sphingobacteriaceae bacterium]
MKDFIIKPEHLNRIELWAASTIYVFAAFFTIAESGGPNEYYFHMANTPYSYYGNYFFPQLIRYSSLFGAFLLLNFKVFPWIIEKTRVRSGILMTILVFLVIGVIFSVTDTYLSNYRFREFDTDGAAYNDFFAKGFLFSLRLMFMYSFYAVIKSTSLYLLSNSEVIQSKYRIITRDSLIAFVLWMISFLIMMIANAEEEFILLSIILVPGGILLYCYSFYTLIPRAWGRKRAFLGYLSRVFLVLLIATMPISLFVLLVSSNEETALIISLFNAAFQIFLTAPISWTLYKRRLEGSEELVVLKKELGRSNANLDFLRSQINPHFLFNALNTIYGTAIQEKAERTGEGIEKLGEMMRFMLQENMQDKISLAREIEYLENYIGLQRLRTDQNPMLKIETSVATGFRSLQIAPMLLIPFVENAFKHGISFREASHIRISLEVTETVLNFDVYNSRHAKSEHDPEKDKSGIGLINVRQRLQLLYPKKHELMIRETGKEFFVHLTLQLS